MRRALPALALTLTLAPGWPASADPAGVPCHLEAADPGPTSPPGLGTASLSGGPVVADGADHVLVCAVQVGGTGVHSDPDATSAAAASTNGVSTLGPVVVSVSGDPADAVYVCTAVDRADGTTLYYDDASAAWGTDASSAHCVRTDVVAAPEPPDPPVVYGAVAGMISIARPTSGAPVVTVYGYFQDPSLFACTQPAWDPDVPVSVTCVPQPAAPVTFYCAVLHANAHSTAPVATRTRMDCDGGGPEATAQVASGPDADVVFAVSNVPVSAFTCTADDGAGHALLPGSTAGCGDPGLAEIHWKGTS